MSIDDRLFGALICLLGIGVLWYASGFPEVAGQYYGPAMFPSVIGWSFVLSGVWLFAGGFRKSVSLSGVISFPDWHGPPRGLVSVALMLVSIPAFVYLGDSLGFQVLSFVTMVLLYVTAGRSILKSVAIAFLITLAVDLLFSKLLRVPLPSGLLTDFFWW